MGGWSDAASNPLINELVVNPKGTYFLFAEDTVASGGEHKTGAYLSQLASKAINAVGAEAVVALIADSAANNVTAGEIVELEFDGVYFVRCACHGADLSFEDIFKIEYMKDAAASARQIGSYIKNHHGTTAAWKELEGTKALLLPAPTRFSTNFIMLQQASQMSSKLQQLVVSGASGSFGSTLSGREAKEGAAAVKTLVLDAQLFAKIDKIVAALEPMNAFMRELHGNAPMMGKVFHRAYSVHQAIAASDLPAGVRRAVELPEEEAHQRARQQYASYKAKRERFPRRPRPHPPRPPRSPLRSQKQLFTDSSFFCENRYAKVWGLCNSVLNSLVLRSQSNMI